MTVPASNACCMNWYWKIACRAESRLMLNGTKHHLNPHGDPRAPTTTILPLESRRTSTWVPYSAVRRFEVSTSSGVPVATLPLAMYMTLSRNCMSGLMSWATRNAVTLRDLTTVFINPTRSLIRLNIKVGQGLVKQQHLRVAHQRLGQEYPLQFASGQRTEGFAGQFRCPDSLQRLKGYFLLFAGRQAETPLVPKMQGAPVRCIRCSSRCRSCGAAVCTRSSGLPRLGLASNTFIVPLIGCCRPRSRRNIVVFPAPLGPMTATNSPRLTLKFASCHTGFLV